MASGSRMGGRIDNQASAGPSTGKRWDGGRVSSQQNAQVDTVDRLSAQTSTGVTYSAHPQVTSGTQPPTNPLPTQDVTKPSKSTQKARPPVSATKRTRTTSTSKAKDLGDAEGKPVAKKAKTKASKAAEGGSSVAKSNVGAKEVKDGSKKAGKAGRKAVAEAGRIVKKEEDMVEVPLAKVKKTKAPGVTKPRTTQPLIAGQPRWTVPKNLLSAFEKMEVSTSRTPTSDIRPAVWASSKDELLSALPDLVKATNGVAWTLSEVPTVLLGERNTGLSVSNVQLGDKPSLELTLARHFACTPSDLAPPSANSQKSHQDFGGPQGTLPTGSPGAPGHAVLRELWDPPALPRPLPPSPRKTHQGVYIIDAPKTYGAIKTEFNFDTLHRMSPEPGGDDGMVVGDGVPVSDAPVVVHHGSGSSPGPYPTSRPYADDRTPPQERSDPQPSPSSPFLKRGPEHPTQLEEGPSKRIKLEAMTTSLPDLQDPPSQLSALMLLLGEDAHQTSSSLPAHAAQHLPGSLGTDVSVPAVRPLRLPTSQDHGPNRRDQSSQQLAGISPPLGESTRQTTSSRPSHTIQYPPGTSSTDISVPVAPRPSLHASQDRAPSRSTTISRVPPAVARHQHRPSTLPAGSSSSQPFVPKSVPTGIRFNKKPKVEPQEPSVPGADGHPPPKPTLTPLPDLPFGRPVHQRTIVKDELREAVVGPSSLGPGCALPLTLPPEVQVLLDAYVSGRPIVAIASHAVLLESWGIALPLELAYAFLGFFRVRRVWETCMAGSPSSDGSAGGHATGQVEWRFRCEWAPGRDEIMSAEPPHYVARAWWASGGRRWKGKGKERAGADAATDTDTESSIQYREARRLHPNYRYRNEAVSQGYDNFVPRHVRAPDQPGMPDEVFSLGWVCAGCGRLNYRAALRHRTCGSSHCKDRPPPPGYALPLVFLREPQQGSPVPQPDDTYPRGVRGRVALWDDHMRTYTYVVAGGEGEEERVVVKHVFTSNGPALQGEADALLEAFQLCVPMRRKTRATLPYFEYVVGAGRGAMSASAGSVSPTAWKDAPRCVVQTKEHLEYCGHGYGEKAGLKINKLSVLAWITSGTRKGASSLHCKASDMVIMCLGADTAISLVPKSGFPGLVGPPVGDAGSAMLVDDDEAGVPEVHPAPADEDDLVAGEDMDVEPDVAPGAPVSTRAPAKPPKPAMMLTLVHGDVLILSGDDFEYSIKRSGTSILLIGS